MFECGAIIDDRYEILSLIGEGGMSFVYLARDVHLGKLWAVKVIKRLGNPSHDAVVRTSFRAEAELMRSLDHPSLPRIVGIIEQDGLMCVIMDYIEGRSLRQIVLEQGPQSHETVVAWGLQLCETLGYLHSLMPPVIYRDMKPSNIVLREDGTVRLVDFGVARRFDDSKLSDTVNLGTRGFAAPEQFDGHLQSDMRTDVYGLGATLYYLLTAHDPSKPPYEMKPLRIWNPHLPAGLERVIARCTAPDPSQRFSNCRELAYALENYHRHDEAYRLYLMRRLRRFVLAGILSVCFLLAGISSLALAAYANERLYDACLIEAEACTGMQAAQVYKRAIDHDPTRPEAYLGLVAVFADDEHFTLDEEFFWQEAASATLACIQKDPRYPELCYAIGRTYWLYYDYGQSDVARWRLTQRWFGEAAACEGFSEHDTAQVYAQVAVLMQSLERKVDMGEESNEDYRACWDALCKLFEHVCVEQTDLGRTIGAQSVIRILLQEHAHIGFAGISVRDIRGLADEAYACLSVIDSQSAKVCAIRDEALNTKQGLMSSLDADEKDLARQVTSPLVGPRVSAAA